MKILKTIYPGVIASILATAICILFVNFIWPFFYYREAREIYEKGRKAYFKCEFSAAQKLFSSALVNQNYALAHAALAQLYSIWAAYNNKGLWMIIQLYQFFMP